MFQRRINRVFSLLSSTEVEAGTSYMNPLGYLLGGFTGLQGVQMALPFLIISKIKKVAELIKREYAIKNSECNVTKPQHSTLKCIEARQTKRLSSYFHP